MCWACFKRYTDRPVINERVVAAYRLIKNAPGDVGYTSLSHLTIGDMNLDDRFFDLDHEGSGGRLTYDTAEPWDRAIFDTLKALSEPERATAVAMEWGYIHENGTIRGEP